jgi:hypothetical protein
VRARFPCSSTVRNANRAIGVSAEAERELLVPWPTTSAPSLGSTLTPINDTFLPSWKTLRVLIAIGLSSAWCMPLVRAFGKNASTTVFAAMFGELEGLGFDAILGGRSAA